MMVGFPGPHCPYDPSPRFLDAIDPERMPPAIPEMEGDAPELRRKNIEGNKRSWNGVDYTDFTASQKRRIRAHYAALVAQIDHEVGQILDVLSRKGLLDNTVIVFSSDHGDYLGDHNLIGKGSFFESSIRVPLLVHLPWHSEARTSHSLTCLSDVTPTLLHLAGCAIPEHMDAVPLPELDIPNAAPREFIVGLAQGGWMIDNGTWRMSKYGTGENLLFHLAEDPAEQHNLYDDPGYLNKRTRLDALLTREIMNAIRDSQHDQRVYTESLSQHAWFGHEGWQRPYPRPLGH
jgi:arylsulfatase